MQVIFSNDAVSLQTNEEANSAVFRPLDFITIMLQKKKL